MHAMYKVEPMEVIENPLMSATESPTTPEVGDETTTTTANPMPLCGEGEPKPRPPFPPAKVAKKINLDLKLKRRSLGVPPPQPWFPLVNSSDGMEMTTTPPTVNGNEEDGSESNGTTSPMVIMQQSQSHQALGQGKGGRPTEAPSSRNRHSSGCLPSEPLLTAVNPLVYPLKGNEALVQPSSNKTLSVRINDDGFCTSFTTANNSEGLHLHSSDCPTKPVLPNDLPEYDDTDTAFEYHDPDRETWGQGIDFLLSIIGFAVDLANVWRFPYYCYKNGGGAFLIPYMLMLVFSAIPIFYMELLLGQSIRQGPISMWKICPLFKGIGYCAVTVSFFVSFYYNTIMGWALHYTINSFVTPLPWTTCNNTWNTPDCFIPPLPEPETFDPNSNTSSSVNMTRPPNAVSPASEYFRNSVLQMKGRSIDNLGAPKMDLLFCVVIVYLVLYATVYRGIRSSGKVVWVTATLPYIVLAILLCRGLLLEGAYDGIYYYLVPNMTKLKEVEVWSDAAKQIFFSSGAGFGVHLTYASYNNFHNNCYRDCLVTSFVNCFTSLFSGFVIFTYLGAMSFAQRRPIDEVVNIGPGLVFEVYPEAVGTLPGSNFWSLLFFLMLIMLGIDSAMGGLECVITGITDEFKNVFNRKAHSKKWFQGGVIFVSFLISIVNITRGGIYTFTFFDTYAAGSSLLISVLFECLAVSWVYGLDQLCKDTEAMLGHAPSLFWRFCWKFISPVFIAVIIILDFCTSGPLKYEDYTYPTWAQVFGYIFTFIPVTLVPIFACIEFFKYPGPCKEKLSYAVTPISEHGLIKDRHYVKRFKLKHWLYIR